MAVVHARRRSDLPAYSGDMRSHVVHPEHEHVMPAKWREILTSMQ